MRQPANKSCRVDAVGVFRLHPTLKTYLGYGLQKSALKLRALLDTHLASLGYDLIAPQCGMLVILKIEGKLSQAELGQFLAMDKATMVRMIDGLEEAGLVKRVPSKVDRRVNALALTETGRKSVTKILKIRARCENEFLSPLTKAERARLLELITKLL